MSPITPTIAVSRSTRPHVRIDVPRSTPAARRALSGALTALGLPIVTVAHDAHALRCTIGTEGAPVLRALADADIEAALRTTVFVATPLGAARHADGQMLEALAGPVPGTRGRGETLLTPGELEQLLAADPVPRAMDCWDWHLGGAYLHGVMGEHDCDVEGSLEAVLAMTDGVAIARSLAARAATDGESGPWQQALDRALKPWPEPQASTARAAIAEGVATPDQPAHRAGPRPRGA